MINTQSLTFLFALLVRSIVSLVKNHVCHIIGCFGRGCRIIVKQNSELSLKIVRWILNLINHH
jgi:hypothetical protein